MTDQPALIGSRETARILGMDIRAFHHAIHTGAIPLRPVVRSRTPLYSRTVVERLARGELPEPVLTASAPAAAPVAKARRKPTSRANAS